jgi:uncharacterized membrane protein YkoI
MKLKIIICGLLASGLLVGTFAPKAHSAEESQKESQATLKSKATVSKAEAKQTALAEVKKRGLKHPKVKESELEQEKGLLVWSFDIKTKGTKDITEVQVDAKTGAVVSVTTESAADEAKEKQSKP